MIRLVKVLAVAFFNLQIFWREVSLAVTFARVNTGAYKGVTAEILMILYAISLFLFFRNFGILLNLFVNLEDSLFREKLLLVGKSTLVLIFIYLILLIVPEYMVSASYQIQ